MSNFRVGQKVVCINATGSAVLRKGHIYTVWETFGFVLPTGLGVEDTGISLVEIEPQTSHYGFAASRFRPAVEPGTETGMSILRELLNKADKPIEVDA